jgi:hypothetical protein
VSSGVGSILIILGAGTGFFMFFSAWVASLAAAYSYSPRTRHSSKRAY